MVSKSQGVEVLLYAALVTVDLTWDVQREEGKDMLSIALEGSTRCYGLKLQEGRIHKSSTIAPIA